MSAKISTAKKIVSVAGACAVLFAAAACTKEVEGTATAAPVETTEPSSSSKPTESSESSESSSSSSSEGGDGGTAAAPDQPYSYTDGTSVTLGPAQEKNDIPNLLSYEVGRVLPFHVENKSTYTLDFSTTQLYADVDCEGSSAYVFPSIEMGGPEQLASGQSGDYTMSIGLKEEDQGKTCIITFPFETQPSVEVDTATFSMTLS